MKLLCINFKPDLSYFSKRGLNFDVEYIEIFNKFKSKFLYEMNVNGSIQKFYTPDVNYFLAQTFPKYKYAGILFGYKPKDYGLEGNTTGGYTYFEPLPSGAFWATVRLDGSENLYAVHELHHLLCNIIQIRFGNRVPIDFMDNTFVNGKWIQYYKNFEPDAPDGNHARTWENIKKWLPQLKAIEYEVDSRLYKPKNFALSELVSPKVLQEFGDKAWEFLDERMLRNLQFIRDNLGPITVNKKGLFSYRGFDACEERSPTSQHCHGRAVDFDVKGMTAEQVREWIVANQDKFPEPNMWIEKDVNWVHIDVRYSEKKGVFLFNP